MKAHFLRSFIIAFIVGMFVIAESGAKETNNQVFPLKIYTAS
jgi:hypothetical protein